MKKLVLFQLLAFFCNAITAQQDQNSTTSSDNEMHVRQPECITKSPGVEWEQGFQSEIAEYRSRQSRNESAPVAYTIPVIVHVLYNGSTEAKVGTAANVKAEQIKAQIDALNDAFAGNAPGNSKLPSPFASVDANNITIRFCLAVKDKNGNAMAEPGIERIDWKAKGWTSVTTVDGNTIQNYYDNTVKPTTIWDPTKYFNIWIGDFFTPSGGIIGYAKFPPSSTLVNNFGSSVASNKNDGVVMGTRCFGCKAKFSAGYYADSFNNGAFSYGITTVHEAGHWLGLHHISGDKSCGDDYCSDTPPQKGGNAGCAGGLNWNCPSYPFQANKCTGNPNGEMFQNFMDYTDDYCRSLFTADQATRMMTAMANSPNRKLLGTHGVCSTATDVADLENSSDLLKIYPNPNNGNFTVVLNSAEKSTCELQIRNVLGQIVYSETLSNLSGRYSKEFNVSEYGKGIYMISVAYPNTQTVQKVIVY